MNGVFCTNAGEGYALIKPHHFPDHLYDLAIGYRHEDEVNVNESGNGGRPRRSLRGSFKTE